MKKTLLTIIACAVTASGCAPGAVTHASSTLPMTAQREIKLVAPPPTPSPTPVPTVAPSPTPSASPACSQRKHDDGDGDWNDGRDGEHRHDCNGHDGHDGQDRHDARDGGERD